MSIGGFQVSLFVSNFSIESITFLTNAALRIKLLER